ncbi:MAG: polynucleotide adenylyltransferase PcnB [Rubrivivax sp.]|nr:polynucleotide adenylyltransferase PcnB [Rubrivivax sp.]
MIKKFISRLFGSSDVSPAAPPLQEPPPPAAPPVVTLGQRQEYAVAEHGIDPSLLDDNAVRVVRTLKEAGYEAYVVGGAVRDLLVGRRPKDFDVATDATPEQVKGLFRRAFIIGRRFRIVHVVFGRGREHEVIEVSTFRALLDAEAAEQVAGNEKTSRAALAGKAHVVDASGRVLRDNVWGPQIEDAARRDFTVNAMYYEPLSQTVVDYHGGLADVRARVLRMIGDPVTRYREDPVRIVRAVRFAAKLGLTLEPKTRAPIRECAALLANIPASRLFDEMIKLLQTGHALASLEELQRQGLERGLFPILDAALSEVQPGSPREAFVRLALQNTDERVADGRPVAPSFLLACLLWHEVQTRWQQNKAGGESAFPALQQAIDSVFEARVGDISGRGKLAADMREIWQMQPRFERRTPASAPGLVELPRFRAGYDFLRLRADVNEVPTELADWWEDFSLGGDDDREAMLQELRAQQSRRVPGPKGGRGAADAAAKSGAGGPAPAAPGGSAPVEAAAAPAAASPVPERSRSRRPPRPPAGEQPAPAPQQLDLDLSAAAPGDAPPAGDESPDAPARKRRRRRRRSGRGAGGEGEGAAQGDEVRADDGGSTPGSGR